MGSGLTAVDAGGHFRLRSICFRLHRLTFFLTDALHCLKCRLVFILSRFRLLHPEYEKGVLYAITNLITYPPHRHQRCSTTNAYFLMRPLLQ